MLRLVALLSSAALAATVAGFGTAGTVPVAEAAPARSSFTPTFSAWTDCRGGDLCAKLTVPLDYAHPTNGQTVQLAVRRAPADPAAGAYQGIVLVNPGGPGASGTGSASLQAEIPQRAGYTYDWIGFDPRGVGASVPALRCNSRYFGFNRPSFVPTTAKVTKYWLTKTRRYAAQCGSSAAKRLLPFMTTRDAAQDMESIRVALQAAAPALDKPKLATLNYYGSSYGTYLGQVYATLYPTKVGRFVLDGVVDPTRWWYGSNLDQDVAFNRNINLFFKWLAAHPRAFGLGTSWQKIRKGYYAELKKLDKRPAANKRLGPDELNDAILDAAYYTVTWQAVGYAYADLIRNGRGNALLGRYAASSTGDDNGYAVYLGTMCTDARRPTWAQQKKDATRLHKKHPFVAWNNTWYNAPCTTWPAPVRTPVNVSGAAVTGRILMINETLDAATPYSGALTARGRFPTSRLIAGVGGTMHSGALFGVACVENRIAAFLRDGSLPARQSGRRADVSCPKVAPSLRTSARVGAR